MDHRSGEEWILKNQLGDYYANRREVKAWFKKLIMFLAIAPLPFLREGVSVLCICQHNPLYTPSPGFTSPVPRTGPGMRYTAVNAYDVEGITPSSI